MNKKPLPAELKEGGVILVDKPYTWTSFDVVNKIKNQLRVKIGHAGTLDPLATGLLICCTGKYTKNISEYQQAPKEYTGIIRLGMTTPTFDLESEPGDSKPYDHLTPGQLQEATNPFIGAIRQVPPAHSAIKKDGKRAYELARKGEDVKMEPRTILISVFELTKIELPEVHFRVVCSTGTYIRSLARDFGEALGCGGYLQALVRTRIGAFDVKDALSPEEWINYWKENTPAP